MSIVVGYGPQERGREALEFGKALARSTGDTLVVCTVVLDRWEVELTARSVDRQYVAALTTMAEDVLDDAKVALAKETDLDLAYDVVAGISVPQALIDEAAAREARICALGSSIQSRWGELALGSVSQRLLVSSPVPIAVAPRGYRVAEEGRVRRVILGVDPGSPSEEAALSAAVFAADCGAELHLVSFATSERENFWRRSSAEDDARVRRWEERAGKALKALAATINAHPRTSPVASYRVVRARGWRQALERVNFADQGDLLVVGSCNVSPMKQVFIGSTAMRILKHSPVPVLVLPPASLTDGGTAVV